MKTQKTSFLMVVFLIVYVQITKKYSSKVSVELRQALLQIRWILHNKQSVINFQDIKSEVLSKCMLTLLPGARSRLLG